VLYLKKGEGLGMAGAQGVPVSVLVCGGVGLVTLYTVNTSVQEVEVRVWRCWCTQPGLLLSLPLRDCRLGHSRVSNRTVAQLFNVSVPWIPPLKNGTAVVSTSWD
jgi:hypothetical protein